MIFVDSQCTDWESCYYLVYMSVLVTRLITDCIFDRITSTIIVFAYILHTGSVTYAANNLMPMQEYL